MDLTYWFFALISSTLFFAKAEPEFDAKTIIGGNVTDPNDYRYVVGINCNERKCLCTGSIIDERFVVSAAHCFFKDVDNIFTIVAGTNDVADEEDTNRIERDVERIYMPAGYNATNTYADDIAVLKLKDSLLLKKNKLQKLRLPAKTRRFTVKQAVLLGFGTTKLTFSVNRDNVEEEITYPNTVLHSADVKLVPNKKCDDGYVVDSNLCGKMMKEKSAKHYGGCSGDSGGPLVYKSKVLIGIYINGPFGCNERYEHGVYTNVKSHIDFIERAMRNDTKGMVVQDY